MAKLKPTKIYKGEALQSCPGQEILVLTIIKMD